jgi:arylsulfatase A-like enzyme
MSVDMTVTGVTGRSATGQGVVRWVWLVLLGLMVAWKLLLFRPGQFHVQWVMSSSEILSCALQDVMVWAALYGAVCLLLRGRRPWAVPASIAAAHGTMLLVLVDVRCKQLLYQPLRWSSLREAAADAAVAKSSVGLFFGPAFVAAVLISFALLSAPSLWVRLRARREPPPDGVPGARETRLVGALFVVSAALVALVGRQQAYHLDANVLSGWLVDGLRERHADANTRIVLQRCDQQARVLGAADLWQGRATRSPLAPGKNVVVFVAESLSFAASTLGDPTLETTPLLRELAAAGPIATACRVQAAASTKSLYSLLTGRYASPHLEMLESMVPRLDSLPRSLARAGYFTAFVTSQFLTFENSGRQYRAMGFDRIVGAEELTAMARRQGRAPRPSSSWGVDDRELAGAVRSLLPRDRPFFLVVYDVASHHPFDYPDHPAGEDDFHRYLHALRYGDDALRAVYQELRRQGHADDTVFVLLGDHGENVTPGQYTVRGCLLAELEHVVPLVMAVPGGRVPTITPAGPREIDIAPTILDLVGVAPEGALQGRSLLDGRPAPAAYINSHGRCEVSGIVEGNTKLLLDRRTRRAVSIDLTSPDPDAHPRPLAAGAAGALAARLEACAAYNEAALRALVSR